MCLRACGAICLTALVGFTGIGARARETSETKAREPRATKWVVQRRFTPWRRVVQPYNLTLGSYRRYRVTTGEQRSNAVRRAMRRHEARKANRAGSRERTEITGWQWLYIFPWVVIVSATLGILRGVQEFVIVLAQTLAWLVLLPCVLFEMFAQLCCGAGLWLLRAVRLVRARVDVLSRHAVDRQICSLTVITVPGHAKAKALAARLRGELDRWRATPDPEADPGLAGLLNAFGARVERHSSVR